VGQLRGYLQSVHDRYHLPIWLTEYALIKFDGGGATYPMLQSLPYVESYAWFALPVSEDHQGTGLYRNGTSPTPAGVA